MGNKYFSTRKTPFAKIAMLLYQKNLIEQHYSFLKCRIEDKVLVCKGTIKSERFRNAYKIEIRCVCGHEPHCKIIEPFNIEPSKEIHMYSDRSLCLHYPPDMKWTARTLIYKYTIPWIVEWILFYELYLVNGNNWEGPESPAHFEEHERNISKEVIE